MSAYAYRKRIVLLLQPGGVGWAALRAFEFSHAKGQEEVYRTAVYHPPKSGMPYLVTVSPGGVTATACDSKDEARMLAAAKAQKVSVEDMTSKQ